MGGMVGRGHRAGGDTLGGGADGSWGAIMGARSQRVSPCWKGERTVLMWRREVPVRGRGEGVEVEEGGEDGGQWQWELGGDGIVGKNGEGGWGKRVRVL